MKLVKIGSVYPSYTRQLYDKIAGLGSRTSAEQGAVIDYDAFGWADFWAHALKAHGYEPIELRANVEPLQRAWAKEHGLKSSATDGNWVFEILLAQLKDARPEILFVDAYDLFSRKWIQEIKRECPSIRLVLGWCGAPFDDPGIFRGYDAVLSNIPDLVEQFRRMGLKSEHVNHAFDKRVLERIDLESKASDPFSFVGAIVRSREFHREREELLERLVAEIDIRIYSPSSDVKTKDELKAIVKKGAFEAARLLGRAGINAEMLERIPRFGSTLAKAARWQTRPMLPVNRRLKPFLRPGVFGLDMFQVLRQSHATLNCHIDISGRAASNMRLFEATGVGTCLVTDWKDNIRDLFEPDSEIVTYRTPDECIEKVRWLLAHPKERDAIARAGQVRTLKDHSFELRAGQLDGLIRRWIVS